ncbi:hypothetical protein M0R04_10225 [Candidatus Dojkabacteria bacterium]|jgi:hypothetical protein|nr:hypothetical protein [Candidatus Dojkabacteria bacterium]
MKNNQLSRYGAIAKMLPFTPGKIFFVVNTAETYWSDFEQQFPPDEDGLVRVYGTVKEAYDACRSGYNDVIVLDGNTTHSVSAMLAVSKNRVHFIGIDWLLGDRRHYGQSSKIQLGVTTLATDVGVIKNTGIRNSFRGIKFDNSNTLTQSIYTLLEGGEYTYFENCEIYNATHLTITTAAELVLNGDSAKFKDCTFGSLANFQTGTTIRPVVELANGIVASGKVMRDCYMENCLFWKNSGHVNSRFIRAVASADVERALLLKDCSFVNAANSAAVPAQAVSSDASLTVGAIMLKNCSGFNVTKLSTTTGVLVDGAAPNSGTGIAVNAV